MQAAPGELAGRVVVVTGAARGMGAATARALLGAGARLVALDLSWGRINDFWSDVGAFREELERAGALVLEGDVSSDRDVDAAYEATMARFGTVDALINNAALLQNHLFPPSGRVNVLDTSDEDWEKMLRVNVLGTLKVIRRFVRPMIEQRRGSIVNFSTSGTVPQYFRPGSQEQPYMASKAAILSMSIYLAEELKDKNVAVNAVFPGHSEMTGWERVDRARREMGLWTPTSRQVPEHIAPLILFLAAHDTTNGPTGHFIHADEWNVRHGAGTPASWLRENR
jgi:NAD(P)-dependent dehydrogenase (short-subunit alcohol dehydrogenase family)